MVHEVLFIVAVVSFFLAAIGASVPKVNLVALGLCCWAISTRV